MELTTQQVASRLYFIHTLSQRYMKNKNLRTTTFIKPHEYPDCPYDCMGLFSFSGSKELKENIFGVMSNGTITEIKERFFPQMMIQLIEEDFRSLLNRTTV
jgi:hypothetical protein